MPQSKRHPARRPQRRPARAPHRNPAATSAPPVTATGFRGWLESWSGVPLLILSRQPSWLVPGLLAVFLVAGLAIPARWAGLLLLVPMLFLAWLAALSWPRTSALGKVLRVLTVLALLAATVARLRGVF
ncbi:MAG TPA: DUF6703 family protein [Candidatus Nanopelagicales bacterium]|nr:DUF6703 family protein [Candidatus Nanopelagicales bacterium]